MCICSLCDPLGAAVIGVYAGFCVYYHGHYFPHTTICGISCGNQTADDLEAKNIASAQNYQLHITDRKGTKYTLSGSDFSYTYKRSGEEQSLVKQQKILLWPYTGQAVKPYLQSAGHLPLRTVFRSRHRKA